MHCVKWLLCWRRRPRGSHHAADRTRPGP